MPKKPACQAARGKDIHPEPQRNSSVCRLLNQNPWKNLRIETSRSLPNSANRFGPHFSRGARVFPIRVPRLPTLPRVNGSR